MITISNSNSSTFPRMQMISSTTTAMGWRTMVEDMNKSMLMRTMVELGDHSNITQITNERVKAKEMNDYLKTKSTLKVT